MSLSKLRFSSSVGVIRGGNGGGSSFSGCRSDVDGKYHPIGRDPLVGDPGVLSARFTASYTGSEYCVPPL